MRGCVNTLTNKVMATKEKNTGAVDDIFAILIGQHNKVTPNSAALGREMDSEVKIRINSGSMLLNMILSNSPDGGWPCGRIVEVFGPNSSGKSTLGYVAMANAQAAGGIAIYIDLEKTGNPDFMRLLGINLDELITTDIREVENIFTAIERNLVTIAASPKYKDKPVMIVVDSVTALLTDVESEAGYQFNMNVSMAKAKMIGIALRKIVPYLSKANACLYFVNQIRDNVTGYGEKFIVPGGNAIPFYSSIRVYLESKVKIVIGDETLKNAYEEAMLEYKALGGKKAGLVKPEAPKPNKDNETTIGYEITAFTKKNKLCPQDRRAKFKIIFSQGLIEEDSWLDPCVKYGIITVEGNKYILSAFENDWGQFSRKQWMSKLQQSEEVYLKIRKLLAEKLTINLDFKNEKTQEVEVNASEDDYTV